MAPCVHACTSLITRRIAVRKKIEFKLNMFDGITDTPCDRAPYDAFSVTCIAYIDAYSTTCIYKMEGTLQ